MKPKITLLTLCICLALTASACTVSITMPGGGTVRGSGDVVSEEREVSGVRKVVLTNQGDLEIEVGDQESLVVEAQANLLPYLETDVRGGTLEIKTQDNVNLKSTKPIRYLLTVTELEGLTVTSSGDIVAPELTADRFTILVSSSGSMLIEALYTDTLDVGISSSGSVVIKGGEVANLDVNISSSGELAMQDVTVQTAEVNLTSSGDALVYVSDELSGHLSSSGNIYYKGDPHVDVNTSSSGKAIQR